ncbi:DUF6282 family protein [Paenibacillus illinoisensis]|uniref:DUF6282 family protein n=1 Tax=Paenibacillus illinoisensis TaxID=59845 RepID=UPI003D274FF9
MSSLDLTGTIDLHIHSAPDIRQRSHNDYELAEQAREIGAKAIVIKSHQFPTAERAWLVNKIQTYVQVYGSITLNRTVGGINPVAVENALQLGAKCVWLPTIDAINHRSSEGKSGGIEVVRDGKTIQELNEIFQQIASHKAILATGHLSTKEIRVVIEEAKKQGVEKIAVTHPEFASINMSLSEQKTLIEHYDVYMERTYAQPIGGGRYKINLEDNLRAIEELGPESTIVSTDSGQIENPPWKVTIRTYIEYLYNNGVSLEAIHRMTQRNPALLLGIE